MIKWESYSPEPGTNREEINLSLSSQPLSSSSLLPPTETNFPQTSFSIHSSSSSCSSDVHFMQHKTLEMKKILKSQVSNFKKHSAKILRTYIDTNQTTNPSIEFKGKTDELKNCDLSVADYESDVKEITSIVEALKRLKERIRSAKNQVKNEENELKIWQDKLGELQEKLEITSERLKRKADQQDKCEFCSCRIC